MASVTILSDNGATSGSAGLKTSGGNDGVLLLQTTTSGGTPTTAISISNTQVVTYTNQPTYTGGTANGVAYLNGSKVLTTGSALTFDGSQLDIPAGSAGAPSLSTPADPNTGIFFPAADAVSISTGGTERLRVDASGNLGLGVTPSAWGASTKALQIQGLSLWGDTGNLAMHLSQNVYDTGSYRYRQNGVATDYVQYNGVHSWYYAASGTAGNTITFTQAMTLDASGNLGVGTTSPGTRLHAYAASNETMRLESSSTSFDASLRIFQNGTAITNLQGGVGVTGGGTFLATITSAPLVFGTGNSERARIDSSGNLLVNTTTRTAATINSSGTLQVNSEIMSVGSSSGVFWVNRSGGVTSNSNWYGWYAPNSTQSYIWNGAGNIASINNSTGAYTALSDANKKKDFEDSGIGLAAVMQLKPTLFRMLDDADDAPKQLGFIAQEVNEVIPQAYVESTMVDASGKNSTYIGLNDRPIIAVLAKAIQELKAEVDALKGQA